MSKIDAAIFEALAQAMTLSVHELDASAGTEKKHITKPRVAGYVVSCVIPLLAIGFGVFLLFNDTIFNTSFLIVMIIFPIIASVLLFFTIFSKMRMSAKIIVAIFILLVFAVMFLLGFGIGHFEELSRYEGAEAIEHYTSASQRSLLPSHQRTAAQQVTVFMFRFLSLSRHPTVFCSPLRIYSSRLYL